MAGKTHEAPAVRSLSDILPELPKPPEDVRIKVGESLEFAFRVPTSAGDYYRLVRGAEQFAKAMKARCPYPAHERIKALPDAVIDQAYWLTKLASSPTISDEEALMLALDYGAVFGYLSGTLRREIGSAVALNEAEELDELGEGSGAIPSTGTT